ncbi:Na+/xyloside symporter related transporter [Listeria floridensis FSL S10-1187]|uniref:Na+/xyloside symporter related transporter n=1 Tax=Listeria floridensis FSL S10-1187 TaxID=1265817 RepID=A0ABN0RD00_9LIST|nr:glycoside-pentoside-hexuronide (GPH):cation symporter [Listeria floridensis]EUJ28505.1 Na+/xyloside symporter related transporter [Listeria floridensis FSL S10-1187]
MEQKSENLAGGTVSIGKARAVKGNQVPWKERIAYAMSDFGCNTVFQILGTYFLVFCTDTLGVAVAATTGLFALTAIIDSIDGVFWGQMIDRTHTKWGKSRPYWLWFSIPFAVFCVMAFSAPSFIMGSETAKIIWIYIAYIGAKVLYSAINIPVTSILPALTSNPKERVTLSTIRQFFGNFGSALFLPLTLPAVAFLGTMVGDGESGTKSAPGWTIWAIILGVITVIAMFTAFRGTNERVVTRDSKRSVPMRESVKAIKGNYPWFIIIFINFVFWGAFAIRSSALPYYFKYNLGQEALGSLTLLGTVLQLATTALVPFFVGRIGKRNTMMIGMVGTILSQLLLFLSEKTGGNVPIILIAVACFYLSQGLIGALIAVMLSDAVDFGEWRNGIRAEGFVTSFSSFSAKLGMGIGSMILAAVLAMGHYIESTGGSAVTQPDSALNSISLGFIWIPLLGYVLSAAALAFNNVDKFEDQMARELEEKHARELAE